MCRDVTMRSVVGNKYEVLHLSPSKNRTILPVSARQMSAKKGRPSAEESKFRLEDTTTGLHSYYIRNSHSSPFSSSTGLRTSASKQRWGLMTMRRRVLPRLPRDKTSRLARRLLS